MSSIAGRPQSVGSYHKLSEGGYAASHGYKWDLYIAFSEDDSDTVQEKIIRELEHQRRNIAYPEKTFIPGRYERDEIFNALEKSFKILVVLSNNFVKTGHFEYITSHVSDDGFLDRFVLINLDDCKVPPNLRTVMCLNCKDNKKFSQELQNLFERMESNIYSLSTKTSDTSSSSSKCSDIPLYDTYSVLCERTGQGAACTIRRKRCSKIVERAEILRRAKLVNNNILKRKRSVGGKHSTVAEDEKELVLLKQDMEHFSVLNFKKDPKTYIHESNRLSQDGETFEYAKDELLKMFASPDRRLTLATLAHLSCFNNDEVRLMALERLEKSLDEDTFDSDRHSAALSEAEEVLREFMLTPSHEPLAYWMHRYQVYGKVVTNFWLHKEKGYLYYDSKKTRALEKLIQDLSGMTDRLGSSDTSFVLRKYNALFTQFAVSRLTGKRDCCVDSGVWARVEQLGQAKLPLKKCPVMEVKHLDKDINNYFHLDVLLSVCSKKVSLKKEKENKFVLVRVILRCLHTLLNRKVCKNFEVVQYGLLAKIMKILGWIVVNHQNKDIRHWAMFGCNEDGKSSGLRQIWLSKSHWPQGHWLHDPFKRECQDVAAGLLFALPNDETRKIVVDDFFRDDHNKDELSSSRLNRDMINRSVVKQITSFYRSIGHAIQFDKDEPIRCSGIMKFSGIFNEQKVWIVVQKLNRIGDLEKQFPETYDPQMPDEQLELCDKGLLNEISFCQQLRKLGVPDSTLIMQFAEADIDTRPLHHILVQLENELNLNHFLHRVRADNRRLSFTFLIRICQNVCDALHHIHRMRDGFIHRDICAWNVKISSLQDGDVPCCKLSNFELAMRHKETNEVLGMPDDPILIRWSAKESLEKHRFSTKTDLYMLGHFFYEVFTYGCFPYQEMKDLESVIEIVHAPSVTEYKLQQSPSIPTSVFKFIQLCTSKESHRRPDLRTVRQALKKCENGAFANSPKINTLPTIHLRAKTPEDFNEQRRSTPLRPLNGKGSSQDEITNMQGRFGSRNLKPSFNDQCLSCLDMGGTPNCDKFRKDQDALIEMVDSQNGGVYRQLKGANIRGLACVTDVQIAQNTFENKLFLKLPKLPCYVDNILDYIMLYKEKHQLKFDHLKQWMIQIADGVDYLHTTLGLVHRDIRAQHVFVYLHETSIVVKLGRFARCCRLSKLNESDDTLVDEGIVTNPGHIHLDSLRWYPPEVILDSHCPFFSCSSDVFSLGLTYWQMLLAFEAEEHIASWKIVPHANRPNILEVFKMMFKMDCQTPPQPMHCPDWLYILLKMMWRDKLTRAPLHCIQDTLGARKPFTSALLSSFKTHFAGRSELSHINFEEEGTGDSCREEETPDHPCIDFRLQEPLDYYMQGMSQMAIYENDDVHIYDEVPDAFDCTETGDSEGAVAEVPSNQNPLSEKSKLTSNVATCNATKKSKQITEEHENIVKSIERKDFSKREMELLSHVRHANSPNGPDCVKKTQNNSSLTQSALDEHSSQSQQTKPLETFLHENLPTDDKQLKTCDILEKTKLNNQNTLCHEKTVAGAVETMQKNPSQSKGNVENSGSTQTNKSVKVKSQLNRSRTKYNTWAKDKGQTCKERIRIKSMPNIHETSLYENYPTNELDTSSKLNSQNSNGRPVVGITEAKQKDPDQSRRNVSSSGNPRTNKLMKDSREISNTKGAEHNTSASQDTGEANDRAAITMPYKNTQCTPRAFCPESLQNRKAQSDNTYSYAIVLDESQQKMVDKRSWALAVPPTGPKDIIDEYLEIGPVSESERTLQTAKLTSSDTLPKESVYQNTPDHSECLQMHSARIDSQPTNVYQSLNRQTQNAQCHNEHSQMGSQGTDSQPENSYQSYTRLRLDNNRDKRIDNETDTTEQQNTGEK